MEQQDKVDVACGPSDSECNMGNEAGAPLVIGPGLRGRASHRGTGCSCTTRIQARTMDQSDQVNVYFWPSNLECNMGNETGAPSVTGPGLREPSNLPGKGHGCDTRTQAREQDEALPALSSEKRRQTRPPKTTRAAAWKPFCQGQKSSAKASGPTDNENIACQPEVLPLTSTQEESSQGSPSLCWSPAFSPAPYMTTTLGQQLIALPSMELHEAFALSNPWVRQKVLMKTRIMVAGATEAQGKSRGQQDPIASDQASVSATSECEEILEAAAALMTLKNSSWTWRQTHS
ncbi:Doublesex- and mab-3-related transcription factor C1 [Microtus ochrogaster]|uniref:Doublesex- and mab-3-related transcription factor C1 n=1 Tax=Microtus ochrogaster TaxID=79684 RepID=A0A8J6GE67_MICOH|nr:Doublesex- and mab-3-related transcription factor C1 [Microtus ochrogaster]